MPESNRLSLKLDGSETYAVSGEIAPLAQLTLQITRADGAVDDVAVQCRLDTGEELLIYQAGGVLQRFAQDFLATAAA